MRRHEYKLQVGDVVKTHKEEDELIVTFLKRDFVYTIKLDGSQSYIDMYSYRFLEYVRKGTDDEIALAEKEGSWHMLFDKLYECKKTNPDKIKEILNALPL